MHYWMIRIITVSLLLSIAVQASAQMLSNLDSVADLSSAPRNKIYFVFDSTNLKMESFYDSLTAKRDSIHSVYYSITASIEQEIRELRNTMIPTGHLSSKLDSINAWRETQLSGISTKASEFNRKAKESLSRLNLPLEIEAKMYEFTNSIDQLGASLPNPSLNMSRFDVGNNINVILPKFDNHTSNVLPDFELPSVNGIEKVDEIADAAQQLKKGMPQDLSNVDQLAESQLMQIGEMGEVKEQLAKLPDNTFSSEEQVKQELIKQAKEAVVDHFANQGQELKLAMEQIAKYKKKFGSFQNLEEIAKRHRNAMHGKPLLERVLPGIMFQLQKHDDVVELDINPYISYRVSGRIAAGLGWNYRLPYNYDANYFDKQTRIFGPRSFGEFKLGRGFSPRLEVEVMNTQVIPSTPPPIAEVINREWVCGVFVGIKKEYKFIKKINGTALVMLRLFDPDRKSPYADVVNARFGFEFPMKKRQSQK